MRTLLRRPSGAADSAGAAQFGSGRFGSVGEVELFAGRLAGADDANDFLGMAIAGARDDGAWGFRAESGGFLEFDFGGVAEGGKKDGDVKVAAAGRFEKEGRNELRPYKGKRAGLKTRLYIGRKGAEPFGYTQDKHAPRPR